MTEIAGLVGLRPAPGRAADITAPPYDVIKDGSRLRALLDARPDSLHHVTLGDDPKAALDHLVASGALVEDDTPAYWVTEQRWGTERRLGFFAAVAVSDYAEHQVIRHEKVFDAKVQGRIRLAEATGVTMEPIFLLTQAAIGPVLERIVAAGEPAAAFTSDFAGLNDLHGIANRVFRVKADSPDGRDLAALVATVPLYIADGHHRYHTALRYGLTHCMSYITDGARIQAYNRVVNGLRPFAAIAANLPLEPCAAFHTPGKHRFCLYTRSGCWELPAQTVPEDVVGRLDCAILERELYPHLGLDHSMIIDPAHFDYYPESQLDQMQEQVDQGHYDLAIALAPVSIEELMAVADAGLTDPEIVMPEKSTFFAPKVLSGFLVYRHQRR